MKSNVPDKIAKTLLGHSSVNMTEYYQNSDIEIAQDYMSKMNLNFWNMGTNIGTIKNLYLYKNSRMQIY